MDGQPNIASSNRDLEYAHHLRSLASGLNMEAELARAHQLYGLQGQLEDAAASARSWAHGLEEGAQ